jgi:hypothetical protein
MAEKTCEITVGRKRKLDEENARGDNVAEKKIKDKKHNSNEDDRNEVGRMEIFGLAWSRMASGEVWNIVTSVAFYAHRTDSERRTNLSN